MPDDIAISKATGIFRGRLTKPGMLRVYDEDEMDFLYENCQAVISTPIIDKASNTLIGFAGVSG